MEIWNKDRIYNVGDVVVVPDKENSDLGIEYEATNTTIIGIKPDSPDVAYCWLKKRVVALSGDHALMQVLEHIADELRGIRAAVLANTDSARIRGAILGGVDLETLLKWATFDLNRSEQS